MKFTLTGGLIAHLIHKHVPTNEQGSNDTPGEGATGTENMPGYGCDMSYAHSGELISHLMTTCAANKWQDSDGAPDGFVEWNITGAEGRFKDLKLVCMEGSKGTILCTCPGEHDMIEDLYV